MLPKKREKSTRLEVLLIAVEEEDKEDQPQSPFHNLHDKQISSFRYSSEDNRQEEEVPQQETPLPIKKKKVAKRKARSSTMTASKRFWKTTLSSINAAPEVSDSAS